MKQLKVKKLPIQLEEVSMLPVIFDKAGMEYQVIGTANWATTYPYIPNVAFRIAYSDEALFIHYRVRENSVRAVAPHDNGHVWEDSCCEFFSSPIDDGSYYNIECNCAGTVLVGHGTGRNNRSLAPQPILDNIGRWSTLGRRSFEERVGDCDWQMALAIPLKTFFMHNITSLQGKSIRANFYKCGDQLQQKHFLSWNPIEIEKPDFHRPDFFGELVFE